MHQIESSLTQADLAEKTEGSIPKTIGDFFLLKLVFAFNL